MLEFKKLSEMKKAGYIFYKSGKDNMLFDFTEINNVFPFTPEIIEQITPQIIKEAGRACYEQHAFCLHAETDSAKYYIDIDFMVYFAYNNAGRRVYALKKIIGWRVVEYKKNICGVVPYGATAAMAIEYGTYERKILNWQSQDVYID